MSDAEQLTHNGLHLLMIAVIIVLLLLLSVKQAEISTWRGRATLCEQKYPYALFRLNTPTGERYVPAQSIDYGRHWIEVDQSRQVLQPPYLHQRYQGFNHDTVEPIVDKPRD